MKKKMLSAALCLFFVIALLPVGALAEGESTGSLPTPYYAILASEAGGDAKEAIRRELGYWEVNVSADDITIEDDTSPAAADGVRYKKVTVAGLGIAHFYIVEDVRTLLIMNEPDSGNKELTVYEDDRYFTGWDPVTITIPSIESGRIYAFGPYGTFAMYMSRALGFDFPVSVGEDGAYIVEGPFYNMQCM